MVIRNKEELEAIKNDTSTSNWLMEQRKKAKDEAMQHLGKAYHQIWKLDSMDRYVPYYLTDFAIDTFNEELVFALHYRTYDYHEDGGHGRIEYTFYIVKKDTKYFIKYFNLWDLEDKAEELSKGIDNIFSYQEIEFGAMTTAYRKFVIDNIMKISPAIDEADMLKHFELIKNTDFSDSFLEDFKYDRATTKMDMIDYHNGKQFLSDDFILKKYSGVVDFINYIFNKCKIPTLKNCNLKYVDTIEEAQKTILFHEIDWKYSIL